VAILFLEKAPGFSLKNKRKLKKWICRTIEAEKRRCGDISFVFEQDEEVYRVNLEYLQHDWYTDVISFDYNEGKKVNGDIIISVDRIKENAGKFGVTAGEEMRRVMIHGVLHLLGYEDHRKEEREKMTGLENKYLALWQNIEGKEDGKV
jgi:rRNA maturation RNase YbeY